MENQAHIQLVRRLFEEVFNQGKINVLEELLTTDVKVFDPSVPNFRGGAQGYKDREQIYHQAFPGKQLTIEEIFMADNDRVVVYWRGQGMQSGDLQAALRSRAQLINDAVNALSDRLGEWERSDRPSLEYILAQMADAPAEASGQ